MCPNNCEPASPRPIHPGALLRERFMRSCGLSVAKLATALGVSRQPVNELLLERPVVSPEMAIRLARLLLTTRQIFG